MWPSRIGRTGSPVHTFDNVCPVNQELQQKILNSLCALGHLEATQLQEHYFLLTLGTTTRQSLSLQNELGNPWLGMLE